MAVSFGIWLSGGIGQQRISLEAPLVGSLLSCPILIYLGPHNGLFYTAVIADMFANWAGYKRLRSLKSILDEQHKPYWKHISQYLIFVLVFYLIAFAAALNNGTINNDAGQVPIRDFVWNAAKCPDTWLVWHSIWHHLLTNQDIWTSYNILINGYDAVVDTIMFSQLLQLDPAKTTISSVHNVCEKMIRENFGGKMTRKLEACDRLVKKYQQAADDQNPSDNIGTSGTNIDEIHIDGKVIQMKMEL